MAARPKKSRAKRESREPVRGSLGGEVELAIVRLRDALGSVAAAARALGLRRQRLSRWIARGLPARELADEAGLVQLLSALYAQFARLDADEERRLAREAAIAKAEQIRQIAPNAGRVSERRRLASRVRAWVRRHQEIADFRKLRRSGVQIFADALGVSADVLRRLLGPLSLASPALFLAWERFGKAEEARRAFDEEERETMEELLELARVPLEKVVGHEWRTRDGRRVKVPVKRKEPVPAKVGTDGAFGVATEGYRWERDVSLFLLPRVDPSGRDGWKVVEKMAAFARSAPGLSPRERYPEWMVTALCSELQQEGAPAEGSRKIRDEFRELDHEDAGRFVVNEAYSSGLCRGRTPEELRRCKGRDKAVDRFVRHIGRGLDGPNVIFAHGIVAWNFRRRMAGEKLDAEAEAREVAGVRKVLRRVRERPAKVSSGRKKSRRRRS